MRRVPAAVATIAACLTALLLTSTSLAADVTVDRTRYESEKKLTVRWPMDAGDTGRVTFDLNDNQPLIAEMAIDSASSESHTVLRNADPVTVVTVGTRNLKDKAGWVAFFDNPPRRPFKAHAATFTKSAPEVTTQGNRVTVTVAAVIVGPFAGDLRFTFYPGSRFVQTDAVITTQQDACAITYDTGLASASPSWKTVSWIDNKNAPQSQDPATPAAPHPVRHRTIVAENADGGSVAIFPPPHRYLYPLDFAENFGFTWHGTNWRDLLPHPGFGIRQTIEGDKRYVPWVNAPPGTRQHLTAFYLLSRGPASDAIDQVRRYTRNDTYKKLPGHIRFTSHYHVEHALDVDKSLADTTTIPGFVKAFKTIGFDAVHLGEFHVHHTPDMNARRLQLLKTLHNECARLSTDDFLLLPGEEPNVHLGGHWISFFPKPVYWTLQRAKDQPFSEHVDGFGTVYHVGNADDVLKLMEAERGLMWTAHPRIKGSYGFPDAYKSQPFYQSDRFLGAAWKAMPADYSIPRLGTRVLDLLDDMNNWDRPKFSPGEVDVFEVEPDYELYGHANVNYVKLDKLPRYADGWGSILEALRRGDFFVTTGEVLIPTWEVDRPKNEVRATVEWTFPLAYAEVISGDGARTYRDRLDLIDTTPFGQATLRIPATLKDRKWARLEVWDIATNGAFTQPFWLDAATAK